MASVFEDLPDIIKERERARPLLEKALDAASVDRRFPQIHAAACLFIAETHDDFGVREYAIVHYRDIVEQHGLAATSFDLRKLKRLAKHAPAPNIRRRAGMTLIELDPPDRFALMHELDRRLGMPEGFSRTGGDPAREDIARYTEGCVKIACADGDVKMRVTALEVWQSFAGLHRAPGQEKRVALLAFAPETPHEVKEAARAVLDNVELVRRVTRVYLEPLLSPRLH